MKRTAFFLSALTFLSLAPATHAHAASCESVATLNLPNVKVTSAAEVAPGAFVPPGPPARGGGAGGVFGTTDVLSRRRDADAVGRLGHQDRSLAAHLGMEREIPVRRQRRVERQHRPERAGQRRAARLRDGEHRHRASGRWRAVDAEPREVDRLRLSCRPRDDRRREGHHRRVLRQPGATLVLHRMLRRWPAGPDRGAALPGRLRRHRRGRARAECHWPRRVLGVNRAEPARQRRRVHSCDQVPRNSRRGATGL